MFQFSDVVHSTSIFLPWINRTETGLSWARLWPYSSLTRNYFSSFELNLGSGHNPTQSLSHFFAWKVINELQGFTEGVVSGVAMAKVEEAIALGAIIGLISKDVAILEKLSLGKVKVSKTMNLNEGSQLGVRDGDGLKERD